MFDGECECVCIWVTCTIFAILKQTLSPILVGLAVYIIIVMM